jgi:hypothetical protein
MDRGWTEDGQRMNRGWTEDEQRMNRGWTEDEQRMNRGWTGGEHFWSNNSHRRIWKHLGSQCLVGSPNMHRFEFGKSIICMLDETCWADPTRGPEVPFRFVNHFRPNQSFDILCSNQGTQHPGTFGFWKFWVALLGPECKRLLILRCSKHLPRTKKLHTIGRLATRWFSRCFQIFCIYVTSKCRALLLKMKILEIPPNPPP